MLHLKIVITITALCLGLVAPVLAKEDKPTASSGSLVFLVDSSVFHNPEGTGWQEIYYYLDAMQLDFRRNGRLHVADLKLTLTVVDSTLTPVLQEKRDRHVARRKGKDFYTSIPFRDILTLELTPGTYGVSLKIEEVGNAQQGTTAWLMKVPKLQASLTASDILFAKDIGWKSEDQRFNKGVWRVLPSVTRRYKVGEPLRFYFELYNLVKDVGEAASFLVGYRLVDMYGEVARIYDDARITKPSTTAAKAMELQTKGIDWGTYWLEIDAFDPVSREYAKTRRLVTLGAPPSMISRWEGGGSASGG